MLFNHSAVQIALGHMDDAVELFAEALGFEEVFTMSGVSPVDGPFRMAVLRQPGTNVDVQFTGLEPIDPPQRKTMNQLGFVSDDAQGEMESVQRWCEARGLETSTGDYGPGFLWIDVPQVFLDFVLEVMDRKSLLATGYSEPEI